MHFWKAKNQKAEVTFEVAIVAVSIRTYLGLWNSELFFYTELDY